MIVQYRIEVKKTVTVAPQFKVLFGRTVVPYGRYIHRFDTKQIEHERLVQRLLKAHRGAIKATLSVQDLG